MNTYFVYNGRLIWLTTDKKYLVYTESDAKLIFNDIQSAKNYLDGMFIGN